MKTFFTVFLFSVFSLTQVAQANMSGLENSIPPNGDAAIIKASHLIRQKHLIDQPDDCYAYKITSQTHLYYELEVKTYHNHRDCPGDPEAFPHLFNVRVSRVNGSLSTDVKAAGKFTKL